MFSDYTLAALFEMFGIGNHKKKYAVAVKSENLIIAPNHTPIFTKAPFTTPSRPTALWVNTFNPSIAEVQVDIAIDYY